MFIVHNLRHKRLKFYYCFKITFLCVNKFCLYMFEWSVYFRNIHLVVCEIQKVGDRWIKVFRAKCLMRERMREHKIRFIVH